MEFADISAGIRIRIDEDFDTLSDYIWKTPRFLKTEIEIESQKLFDYFPIQDDPDAEKKLESRRNLRAQREGNKLFVRFPKFIATSNLFLATSVFEYYLFIICKEIEVNEKHKLKDERGNGVARYFNFLKKHDIQKNDFKLHKQIDAAITIRNCLLHADGNLELSREAKKITHIVKNKQYLSADHRQRQRQRQRHKTLKIEITPDVLISTDKNQLSIENEYAHRATYYFRTYLLELSKKSLG